MSTSTTDPLRYTPEELTCLDVGALPDLDWVALSWTVKMESALYAEFTQIIVAPGVFFHATRITESKENPFVDDIPPKQRQVRYREKPWENMVMEAVEYTEHRLKYGSEWEVKPFVVDFTDTELHRLGMEWASRSTVRTEASLGDALAVADGNTLSLIHDRVARVRLERESGGS